MGVSSPTDEERWLKILTEGHKPLTIARHAFRHVPSAPRCKVCGNPFAGVGGRLFRLAGYSRSRKNPQLCGRCCDTLPAGGAEVDIAVVFADVRGSMTIGEGVDPGAFADLLKRFYRVVTAVLLRHDAVIDKLIGDEVMALFIPGISGPEYRRRAVDAALDVMRAVGYGSAKGPWLRLGAGVNAGPAFVGNVGASGVVDFTALGDTVNVAARLQGTAAAGEVVVAAGVDEGLGAQGSPRMLSLRGRDAPLPAMVLTP